MEIHVTGYVSVVARSCIPKPVWAVGFAPEQPLRDVTIACPASGILKQLEYSQLLVLVTVYYFE
ncbi:MAG: hypothetical protein LBJ00_14570 [Planctomycetaceae bacterium]|nr:hypothetical protein [Planctomycetaceae bacterium]